MYQRKCKSCCMQNNYNENIANNTCKSCDINDKYVATANMDAMVYNMNQYNDCGCGFDKKDSVFPENPVLAQSYVPIQKLNKTFIPCVGLKMGTIFPELVRPYIPYQSIEEIAFIRAMNKVGKGCNKC